MRSFWQNLAHGINVEKYGVAGVKQLDAHIEFNPQYKNRADFIDVYAGCYFLSLIAFRLWDPFAGNCALVSLCTCRKPFVGGETMQKRHLVLIAILMATVVLIGCGRRSNEAVAPVESGNDQVAVVHNVFLESAYDHLDRVNLREKAVVYPASSWDEKVDSGLLAANQMLVAEGLEPMTRAQAEQIMLDGRQHALELVDSSDLLVTEFVNDVLGSEIDALGDGVPSVDYYARYVELRTTMTAEEAYIQANAELGVPNPDTDLETVISTMLNSDRFWTDVYPEEALPAGPQKSWLKVVKFIAVTAADGASGGLAGIGYGSIGGPGGAAAGAVVGGIVGGLASWGAGDIMS